MDFTKITACGECCVGCKKRDDGICQGCIESDGYCTEWEKSNGCPIHKCAKEHNVQFCGLCILLLNFTADGVILIIPNRNGLPYCVYHLCRLLWGWRPVVYDFL